MAPLLRPSRSEAPNCTGRAAFTHASPCALRADHSPGATPCGRRGKIDGRWSRARRNDAAGEECIIEILKGRVLLGWMPREAALSFLRNDCVFDPPLDEARAEALWREYRDRVLALPERPAALPALLPLDEAEQAHARRFRAFLAQQGGGEVQDVVKLDLADLVVTQHFVVAERAQALARSMHGDGDWMHEFLPLALRGSSVRYSFRRTAAVTTCIDFELPHAEFLFLPNAQAPGNFALVECLHHATVMFGADRCFLGSGYHRCYARLASTAPGERATAIVARVGQGVDGDAADPLSPLGARAARFRDFQEPNHYLEADLVMRRFQLQLTARVVALNERRNKARAQGRNAPAGASAPGR